VPAQRDELLAGGRVPHPCRLVLRPGDDLVASADAIDSPEYLTPWSLVRTRLAAGGKGIRTLGPAVEISAAPSRL